MPGESYTSPVTGETYTVPSYEDPADAPIAFKDFADTITGGGGIDIPATRVDAVVQTLNGTSWVEGMALSVSDTVPADTEGQVGDVVFISGLPDGLPVGGGKVIEANSSNAALRVTQTGSGDALRVEDSANPDSTPFVVDSNGRVIRGSDSAINLTPYGNFGIQNNGLDANSHLGLFRWSTGATGSRLFLSKSKGGSIGDYSVSSSGDEVGGVFFLASDGTTFIASSSITAAVDGTPGTNDMPGRLVFSTTADGASSPTERMRITSAGNVGIGTSSPTARLVVRNNRADNTYGLVIDTTDGASFENSLVFQFSGTSANIGNYQNFPLTFITNNVQRMQIGTDGLITGTGTSLGAWTAYTPSVGGFTLGNGTVSGFYCQIGKIVFFRARFVFGSTSEAATSNITIELPFTAKTAGANTIGGTFTGHLHDASAATPYISGAYLGTATTATIRRISTDGALQTMSPTSPFTWTNGDTASVAGAYEIA